LLVGALFNANNTMRMWDCKRYLLPFYLIYGGVRDNRDLR
jgi:hypothetical protein